MLYLWTSYSSKNHENVLIPHYDTATQNWVQNKKFMTWFTIKNDIYLQRKQTNEYNCIICMSNILTSCRQSICSIVNQQQNFVNAKYIINWFIDAGHIPSVSPTQWNAPSQPTFGYYWLILEVIRFKIERKMSPCMKGNESESFT